jgi:DNA-binding LacI/PurR family transcriptional regulator
MKTTLATVARRAGVSTQTVSNVLNHPAVVAAPTLERVLDAIRELNYVPNEDARRLRLGISGFLGILMSEAEATRHPLYPRLGDLAAALMALAPFANMRLVAVPSTRGSAEIHEVEGLDVLLFNAASGPDRPVAAASTRQIGFGPRRNDMVTVERPWVALEIDALAAGRVATQHLLSLGSSRVAFLSDGRADAVVVAGQRRGWLETMRAAAGPGQVQTCLLDPHDHGLRLSCYLTAQNEVGAREKIDGIVCATDHLVALALPLVGADVARVVGAGGTDIASQLRVATVAVDLKVAAEYVQSAFTASDSSADLARGATLQPRLVLARGTN